MDRVKLVEELWEGSPSVTSIVSDLAGGVGVYVKEEMRAGTVIIDSESPLAFSLLPNCRNLVCSVCARRAGSLSHCAGCKDTPYCSTRCQKHDWKVGGHKDMCARIAHIKKVTGSGPTETTMLLARLYRKVADGNRAVLLALATLRSHADEVAEHADIQVSVSGLAILASNLAFGNPKMQQEEEEEGEGEGEGEGADSEKASGSGAGSEGSVTRATGGKGVANVKALAASGRRSIGGAEAFSIACKVRHNAFTLCDAELQPIGLALYHSTAMFNHGCVPNCVATFVGARVSVRTLRVCRPGESLVLSYVDELMPLSERRESLLYGHLISTCVCGQCERPAMEALLWDTAHVSDSLLEELDGVLAKVNESEKEEEVTQAAERFHRLDVPPTHRRAIECRKALVDAYVGHAQYLNALGEARTLVVALEQVYGARGPQLEHTSGDVTGTVSAELAIEMVRLAKLEQAVGSHEMSLVWARKGLILLSVTHGEEHPLVCELAQALG